MTTAYEETRHWIDNESQRSKPVVLSSVQFPTQPSSSSSRNTNSSTKYKHVLTSKAISPQMDLVAIISRDVTSPASTANGGSASLAPSSILAPPPPGMSAAANQARIRMMMMARARALAAAGASAGGTSASIEVPKVTRCAALRLSLWRMASLAGEHGSRVWDVEVKAPDLFKDAGKDVKEMEDFSISAMSWSPNSRFIALAVQVIRRRVEGLGSETRKNSFLLVYSMQDGKQQRVLRMPRNDQSEGVSGMNWCQLVSRRRRRPVPGSANDILQRMPTLPDISQTGEEKESKGRQRQRALNAMRNQNEKQGEVDRSVEEVMQSESDDWATSLLDYPRSNHNFQGEEEAVKEEGSAVELLCIWESHRVHLYLDASIYLGNFKEEDVIVSINIDAQSGNLVVCSRPDKEDPRLTLQNISTGLNESSIRFSLALHLQSLSTSAFDLLTYAYDSMTKIRNLYRLTHINCITPWIEKGRSIDMKHSTHFQTELQMLLLTSTANEVITTVLVGNETMTEGDLNKLRAELAIAWNKMEALFEGIFLALQKVAIVFEEVKGCWLWRDRYSAFLSDNQGQAITTILDLVSSCQQQSLTSLRHVQQETRCWAHFYRWFKLERSRQEAIRDQVTEPKNDASYDVLLVADFLKRGFINYPLERSIGIVLDKKTRGTFVENDDEEEEGGGDNGQEESLVDIPHTEVSRQDVEVQAVSQNDLFKIQERLRKLPEKMELSRNKAPSEADLSCLLSSPFILTGPCKGLHDRQHHTVGLPVNALHVIKRMIELSSSLFSEAFARYASQESSPNRVNVTLQRSPLPLRSDALRSISRPSGSSSSDDEAQDKIQFENSVVMRSCYDQITHQQWLLGFSREDQNSIITLIAHDPSLGTVKLATINCSGHIIDLGFYSTREIVALLREGDITRMLSFSLDTVDFSPTRSARQVKVQRYYEVSQGEPGSGSTQLSLNHAKDVAATLDDQGMLVYWDFVLLDQTTDEDFEMG